MKFSLVSGSRASLWDLGVGMEEEAAGSNYAECVSSNLPSRIHMDKICMQKKLFPFKKASKAEQLDCAPLEQKYLVDLHKNNKDEQEKNSNL